MAGDGWWLVGIEHWNYSILSLLVEPLQVDKFGEWISPKKKGPWVWKIGHPQLHWFIIICPIKKGICGYTDVYILPQYYRIFTYTPNLGVALRNSSQHELFALHLLQKTRHYFIQDSQVPNVVSRLRLLKFDDKPAAQRRLFVAPSESSVWQ